jgi:hypothetical protein
MQRVLLRASRGNALCAMGGRLLNSKLTTLRNHCRHYSTDKTPFEVPEIHFGTETSPSSSRTFYTLRTTLHLPVALHHVWRDFHAPRTLNAITPPHLNFTITTPQPVEMHDGTIIDYRRVHRKRRPEPLIYSKTLNPTPLLSIFEPIAAASRPLSLSLHGVPFKWRTRCVRA